MNTKQILDKLLLAGMTQADIARESGVTQPTISRLLTGVHESCNERTFSAINKLYIAKDARRKNRKL